MVSSFFIQIFSLSFNLIFSVSVGIVFIFRSCSIIINLPCLLNVCSLLLKCLQASMAFGFLCLSCFLFNDLGKNFKFHSNSSIPNKTISSLQSYYKVIKNYWCRYYSWTPEVSSLVSSWFLWCNSYIKIDNKVVF